MSQFQNTDYLKHKQYAGSNNLVARIQLHQRFSTNPESIHRWQFDRVSVLAPRKAAVLEVGCGRGDLWQQNAERIPSEWQITLTDLSAGMLADCQMHLGEALARRFIFKEADIQELPFEDASFGVVIANYMLYHVPNLAQGLREIRRVLKPDGLLFALTNGDNHLIELEQLIQQFARENKSIGMMNIRGMFSLQNGGKTLHQFFGEVQREDFDSNLHVTELQPLLDYIASALDDPETQMQTPAAQKLAAEVEKRLPIHITKETGMFTAQGFPGGKFVRPDYVQHQQYASSDRLAARIRLHARFSTNPVNQRVWAFDHLLSEIPANAQILEIGCGRGDLWSENAGRIPIGWNITLTDLSTGMLADCQMHLGIQLATRFRFKVVDAQAIPYPDGVFDAVIANFMLYHVPDRAKALREFRRVLKPDGVLIAMTNGDDHLRELFTWARAIEDESKPYISLFAQTFSLQNGGDQLHQQFKEVRIVRIPNSLHITALEPILEYIASTVDEPETQMVSPRALAIKADLQARLDQNGAIDIPKDEGLFIARGQQD